METKELEKDFLTMVEAQKRTIYKVCYIYANDQDDLNDLYQETVLNLWKSFPRYRGDSKLTTWVYRIAMNTCITFLRRSNASGWKNGVMRKSPTSSASLRPTSP